VPLFHLAILAVIQGLTEFLPVSSSGHLALTPHFLGLPDQGIAIDVAVHVGTLGAVLIYCWRDIGLMLLGLAQTLKARGGPGATLFIQIILASVPIVVAGYYVSRHMGDAFRNVEVIAWSTLGFGLLLGIADRLGMTIRRLEHMTYGTALFIGIAQIFALVPGASRAGIAMTASRMVGFERTDAARFSLLLSIPAILGAGTLEGLKLHQAGDITLGVNAAVAAGIAFLVALFSIALMMAWLRHAGFMPFVIYRVILGAGLLAWIYV